MGEHMKDVLQEITRLRLERNWSEYELAKHAGLSQSTISTWYRKNQVPTIQTLEKVCKGFGITLSQFFAEGDDLVRIEYATATRSKRFSHRHLLLSLLF